MSRESNEDRVEQVELGKHHGVASHGSRAQMGKTVHPLRRSVAEPTRWNLKDPFHLTTQHLREKTHTRPVGMVRKEESAAQR